MPASRFARVALGFSLVINTIGLLLVAGIMAYLGGPGVIWLKLTQRDQAAAWSIGRIEHFKEIDAESRQSIVFLGDSLTQMVEWGEVYHSLLIKNRGVAGDSIDGVLRRLDEIVDVKPRAVLLMIGINDIPYRDPGSIISGINKIVRTIRTESPSTVVYLQSILPVNNQVKYTSRDNVEIAVVNRALRSAESDNIHFVDLNRLYADENGNLDRRLTNDGVHLNGAGYKIWFEALRPLISDIAHLDGPIGGSDASLHVR